MHHQRDRSELPETAFHVEGRNLAKNLPWFRDLLAGSGIRPPRGSAFGDALRALERVHAIVADPTAPDPSASDMVDALAAALMVSAARVLSTWAPEALDRCLQLFRGQDILLARTAEPNAARNAAWEMFCAATASVGAS